MDQHKAHEEQISIGAMVEATDGFAGTIVDLFYKPNSDQLAFLVIENEGQNKQFTLPADLLQRQVGSRVIYLSIARDQLVNFAKDTEFDTHTANYGHPTPEMPQ